MFIIINKNAIFEFLKKINCIINNKSCKYFESF